MQRLNLNIDVQKYFNRVYIPFLNDTAATQIFFGGTSSGKSFFVADRCVLDVLQGRNYLVCRFVASFIRESVYNQICQSIRRFQLEKWFDIKSPRMGITCKLNGSQILFTGLDDPEKIKSKVPKKGNITDIWVEEATNIPMNETMWQLERRLRGQSKENFVKRIILTFNPIYRSHWIYKDFFEGIWNDASSFYRDESDSLMILKTTYRDNINFLTADDIKRLENQQDEYFYNVYTLGLWGILGKSIFRNWKIYDRLENIRPDNIKIGLDFGFSSHPAAIIKLHYEKEKKEVYVLQEFLAREQSLSDLSFACRRMNASKIIADSEEPRSIQSLRRDFGLNIYPAKKGHDSVRHGITWLQGHTIFVHKSCIMTAEELRTYHWKKDRYGEELPVPVDKNNHLLDAMRYALENDMMSNEYRIY